METFKKLSLIATICLQIFLHEAGADIGVIGPMGETHLFYQDGPYIAVRTCTNVNLGRTPEEARQNCTGFENKFRMNYFRDLHRRWEIDGFTEEAKPLTRDEFQAYKDYLQLVDPNLKEMELELLQLQNYRAAYGRANTNMSRLNLLKDMVHSVKKVDREIEKIIRDISDKESLFLTLFSFDKSYFRYNFLKKMNKYVLPRFQECGTKGTIEERRLDCEEREGEFQLVSRQYGRINRDNDNIGFEYKRMLEESLIGLTWAEWNEQSIKTGTISWSDAKRFCEEDMRDFDPAKRSWRLPTAQEFSQAINSQITKVFGDSKFWTSREKLGGAFIFQNNRFKWAAKDKTQVKVLCVTDSL